jgi:hypothetical protein
MAYVSLKSSTAQCKAISLTTAQIFQGAGFVMKISIGITSFKDLPPIGPIEHSAPRIPFYVLTSRFSGKQYNLWNPDHSCRCHLCHHTYGLGHPMKPHRILVTHELAAYDMLEKMDLLVSLFTKLFRYHLFKSSPKTKTSIHRNDDLISHWRIYPLLESIDARDCRGIDVSWYKM